MARDTGVLLALCAVAFGLLIYRLSMPPAAWEAPELPGGAVPMGNADGEPIVCSDGSLLMMPEEIPPHIPWSLWTLVRSTPMRRS